MYISHEISFSSQSNNLALVILLGFSGNIQEWEAFFNVFNALVCNDLDRSIVEKFFQLRLCLNGDISLKF